MTDLENSLVLNFTAPPGWEPDPVLCACGKAEPLPGDDHCEACEIAFFLAQPEEFDDACDHGYGQTPATKRVVDAVNGERVRRFGEQVPVYRRTA